MTPRRWATSPRRPPTLPPNRCAPDLCLGFSYPSVSLSQGMVYRIDPLSRDALVGHRAHYQLTGGSLPAGLRLDEATGAITGIPTALGEFAYDVQLTVDGYRGSLSTHVMGLVTSPALTSRAQVPTPDQGGMAPGFPVGYAVDGRLSLGFGQANNNGQTIGYVDVQPPPGAQFGLAGAPGLPPGLTLNTSTGAITGTPTEPGLWFNPVVGTLAGGQTFRIKLVIGVAPVLSEHAGGAAPAPVDIPVHAPAGTPLNATLVMSAGNTNVSARWNPSTAVWTVTPGGASATFRAGTWGGAYLLMVNTGSSAGGSGTVGYFEVVDGTLAVH